MTTNLFVIANVKQLRTGGSLRILLPFFPNILGCWLPKFSNFFNSFHNRVEFGTILEGLRNFGGGGGLNPPKPFSPRYATDCDSIVFAFYTIRFNIQKFYFLFKELIYMLFMDFRNNSDCFRM